MRAFVYRDGKAAELPFVEGAKRTGEDELVWLHLDGTDEGATDWIGAQDSIPSAARSALLAVETRPRCDFIGNGCLINLRGPGLIHEDSPDLLVSVRIWAEPGRVISAAYREPMALASVADAFLGARLADPGDILTQWVQSTTDVLDPEVTVLGDELDEIETGMEKSNIWPMRRAVAHVRSHAIALRRFVGPQRMAVERLATSDCAWLDEADRQHLRDAADRVARMAEELEAVRERSALIHEELTDLRSEQLDTRALLISIVALIFLPLTFITGLLGMNVEGIPYAKESWAFWGVVGFCLFIALAVLGWFIRAHWIDRD